MSAYFSGIKISHLTANNLHLKAAILSDVHEGEHNVLTSLLLLLYTQTLHNKADTLEMLILNVFLYFSLSVPTYSTITLISPGSLLILCDWAPAAVPGVAGKTRANLWGTATDTEARRAFVFGIKTQNGISVCALLLHMTYSFNTETKIHQEMDELRVQDVQCV